MLSVTASTGPRTVAIHQPNFFPWLGYFDKLARSDVFVLLDHAQYPKTGGSWSNRVKLLLSGEARWMTAPIVRSVHGVRAIADVEFQPANPWREKFVKSLRASYSRARHFHDSMAWLEPLITNPDPSLARYNAAAIVAIAEQLGIATRGIQWSSSMPIREQSTNMLIEVTRLVGADAYLCGGGAAGYQDDAAFAAASIALTYQHFRHPTYDQGPDRPFTPGLSIIDAVMHLGIDGVRDLLQVPSTQWPREGGACR
jgi:hypothetical protein